MSDVDMEESGGSTAQVMESLGNGEASPASPCIEVSAGREEDIVDDNTGQYTWVLRDFLNSPSQQGEKMHSEEFEIGGHFWRMLVFPRGNRQPNLALYLDAPDAEFLPPAAAPSAKFKLILEHEDDPSQNLEKETTHSFTAKETDWGFTSFCPLDQILAQGSGFVWRDGGMRIKVEVSVDSPDHDIGDSRVECGHVGLKNQGATCYMNSLLQTLYHIPFFRQSVYHMPTEETDESSSSLPVALQALFYKLQFSPAPVSTKDLTKSFGWTTYDAFLQHDVQELNRVLCEKLEEKMKGTTVEKVISDLFEGHTHNYIQCVNVNCSSTRSESFMDIQLDVKGCKDVYASFRKYVEVEMLDGDNKYKAEGFGLQDAKKGVLFKAFPPVLQLQLKRFEYDIERDAMVKINDRYEFPEELDLDCNDGELLAPDGERSVRNLYVLHSVLVHSGSIHGGHYYNFTRPDGKQWFRFDDERVTREEPSAAVEAQYGGEDENPPPHTGYNTTQSLKFTKFSSAYMLVYIRAADWPKIMCSVGEEDIVEHLRTRLQAELRAKGVRRQEKREAHLYTQVRVVREADLAEHLDKGGHFDMANLGAVPSSFRVRKTMSFRDFKTDVLRIGAEAGGARFWGWCRRHNGTMRVSDPIDPGFDDRPLRALYNEQFKSTSCPQLDLFLEEPLQGRPLQACGPGSVLLFFKHYDPESERLSYAGKLIAPLTARLEELFPFMRDRAELQPDTPLIVCEEVKFEPTVMVEDMVPSATLQTAEMENGDIVCFQRAPVPGEPAPSVRLPHLRDFYSYVHDRRLVRFRPLDDPKAEGVLVEAARDDAYPDVVAKLAAALGGDTDPAKLRLTQHNIYSHQPQRAPLRSNTMEQLDGMLMYHNQVSDTMYYERLDIPLVELENLKTLRVAFHKPNTELESDHQVRLPLDSTVGDVLVQLKEQLGPAHAGEPLRLLEMYQFKIFKTLGDADGIHHIDDRYWQLRAEVVPPEERKAEAQPQEGSFRLQVCHFSIDKAGVPITFGNPFLLVVPADTTAARVRAMIQAKLGTPQEEFDTWKLAFVSTPSFVAPLKDEDVLAAKFAPSPTLPPSIDGPFLGLEHEDKNPSARRLYNRVHDRPIKINC